MLYKNGCEYHIANDVCVRAFVCVCVCVCVYCGCTHICTYICIGILTYKDRTNGKMTDELIKEAMVLTILIHH